MFFRMGFTLRGIIVDLIAIYELAIVLRAVLSWFADPYSRFQGFLIRVTEPAISPVRGVLERLIGQHRIDFSPVVTVALLELLREIVLRLFR